MTVKRWVVLTSLFCLDLLLVGCSSSATTRRDGAIVEEVVLDELPLGALSLPNEERSIKFAVIGDSGRGTPQQIAIAQQMAAFRERFDYDFVLMAGDNIYEGKATAEDYRTKFEGPYEMLLARGVKFYAVLGNHDDPAQVEYQPFHMNGHRYYTFTPPVDLISKLDTRVRFFALDSMRVDAEQLEWLERELKGSRAKWKVVVMHYPIYSAGRYSLVLGASDTCSSPIW